MVDFSSPWTNASHRYVKSYGLPSGTNANADRAEKADTTNKSTDSAKFKRAVSASDFLTHRFVPNGAVQRTSKPAETGLFKNIAHHLGPLLDPELKKMLQESPSTTWKHATQEAIESPADEDDADEEKEREAHKRAFEDDDEDDIS